MSLQIKDHRTILTFQFDQTSAELSQDDLVRFQQSFSQFPGHDFELKFRRTPVLRLDENGLDGETAGVVSLTDKKAGLNLSYSRNNFSINTTTGEYVKVLQVASDFLTAFRNFNNSELLQTSLALYLTLSTGEDRMPSLYTHFCQGEEVLSWALSTTRTLTTKEGIDLKLQRALLQQPNDEFSTEPGLLAARFLLESRKRQHQEDSVFLTDFFRQSQDALNSELKSLLAVEI